MAGRVAGKGERGKLEKRDEAQMGKGNGELSGTFCVTLYCRRLAAHRAFVTKKHQICPAGGQTPGG
jgi:hypothetical protein